MDQDAIPPCSISRVADRTTAHDISIDPARAATAQVRIRPVVPGDADGLRALHTAASNQSLYLRFFGYSRTAVEEYLTVLSRPASRTHQAMTAQVGSRLVGVAAFERLTGDTAEVALLVADDHHERGIGTLLMEHLARAARDNGIRRFQADVLGENDLALRMVDDLGWAAQMRYHDGIARVVADLAPDPVTASRSALMTAAGQVVPDSPLGEDAAAAVALKPAER